MVKLECCVLFVFTAQQPQSVGEPQQFSEPQKCSSDGDRSGKSKVVSGLQCETSTTDTGTSDDTRGSKVCM